MLLCSPWELHCVCYSIQWCNGRLLCVVPVCPLMLSCVDCVREYLNNMHVGITITHWFEHNRDIWDKNSLKCFPLICFIPLLTCFPAHSSAAICVAELSFRMLHYDAFMHAPWYHHTMNAPDSLIVSVNHTSAWELVFIDPSDPVLLVKWNFIHDESSE